MTEPVSTTTPRSPSGPASFVRIDDAASLSRLNVPMRFTLNVCFEWLKRMGIPVVIHHLSLKPDSRAGNGDPETVRRASRRGNRRTQVCDVSHVAPHDRGALT